MKKITLLLAAFFALATTALADEQPAFTFNWAHSIDGGTTGGDNIVGMANSANGDYYVATSWGSTSTAGQTNLWFDTEVLNGADGKAIVGSPYSSGSSNNGNLLIQKVSNTGSVAWFGYTRKGDIAADKSHIVATKDGGLLAVVKTRAWVAEAGYDNLIEYVDPTGHTTTIKDMGNVKNEYRYLLLKVDEDGQLQWSRLVAGKVEQRTKALTTDNASIYGVTLDADGNIYLAGNFRTELYFKKTDGTVETLEAQNTADWNGDSQGVVGDLFLVKLDKEGYFTKALTAEGTAASAFVDKIIYTDGSVFFNGRVKGNEGGNYTLGGKAINASTDCEDLILGSVSTADLSVNYVKVIAPSGSKKTIQNNGIQYMDGYVYLTGSTMGGLTGIYENDKGAHRGYLLKVKAATGEVEKNAIYLNSNSISKFCGVYLNGETMYAFGYDMSAGAVLVPVNPESLALGTATTICKAGTVAVCGTPLMDGENIILINRGRNTASFDGTETSFPTLKSWCVVYYSYKVASIPTGVSNIKADAKAAQTAVYTTDGAQVKSSTNASNATSGLSKGVYVVRGKKVMVN